VRYVDAGYIAALGVLFLYGIGLVLRRRRWERALEHADLNQEVGATNPAEQRD
jgi:hypothetical protein